jgi:hypothetical protein
MQTVSITALVIMASLFYYELSFYLVGETIDRLSVDLTSHKSLKIQMDISFPALPCSDVNIDVMDVMGDPILRMQSHLFKTNLDESGIPLETQFHAGKK